MIKNPPANAGDVGSIPGSGRSPGEGNSSSLQYSCWEIPMEKGACWATVHGVAKSQTGLSNSTTRRTNARAQITALQPADWAKSSIFMSLTFLTCSKGMPALKDSFRSVKGGRSQHVRRCVAVPGGACILSQTVCVGCRFLSGLAK